jgi:hypothetical protein
MQLVAWCEGSASCAIRGLVMKASTTSNHAAVESLLVSLRQEKALDTHDEALGRLALTLADALDAGAGMATAAVSKELRATLAALTRKEVDPDADDPIFGTDLPTQVRDTPKP